MKKIKVPSQERKMLNFVIKLCITACFVEHKLFFMGKHNVSHSMSEVFLAKVWMFGDIVTSEKWQYD